MDAPPNRRLCWATLLSIIPPTALSLGAQLQGRGSEELEYAQILRDPRSKAQSKNIHSLCLIFLFPTIYLLAVLLENRCCKYSASSRGHIEAAISLYGWQPTALASRVDLRWLPRGHSSPNCRPSRAPVDSHRGIGFGAVCKESATFFYFAGL